MLNVDGGPDIDPGIEQLFDVLPALWMPWRRIAANDVRVRQLIDQQNGRMASQGRIEIELLPHDITVTHRERRQPLQSFDEPLRLARP